MASRIVALRAFAAGFFTALALAGVTSVTIEAVRRARRKPRATGEPLPIDGVRPLEPAECGARPQEEANGAPERLESEALDVAPESQRW